MSIPIQEAEALEIVSLGSFNPKILHPAWFQKFDIITEADLQESTVRVVSNDVADFEMKGIKIQCLKERLSIGTGDPTRYEMMQDWLLMIFTLLPHVPVTSVGINAAVHYRIANDTERWHRIGHHLVPKELWVKLFREPGMRSLTMECRRNDEFEGAIYVTVEPSIQFTPGLYVRTSHHFQPSKQQDVSGFADFIIKTWKTAREEAKRVAEKIFEEIK
jgi:hypothetical protein